MFLTGKRLCLLLLISATAQGQSHERKNVLIFLPDPPGRPAGNQILDGLQSELRKKIPDVAIFAEFTGANEADPSFRAAELAWFRKKYSGKKFDVLIAGGVPSLDSATSLRRELWPEIPVVWFAMRPDTYAARGSPPGTTGIVMDSRMAENLALVFRLLPETRHFALAGGSSAFDRYYNDPVPGLLKRIAPNVEFIDLTNLGMAELGARVAALPPNTVVASYSYSNDPSGRPVLGAEMRSLMASKSKSPYFGSSGLGEGQMGGYLDDYLKLGGEAGIIALRILGGESVSAIPVSRSQAYNLKFDWRQLKKWNVPLSRLPPGSEILFREESMWERYRWWIAAALLFAALESVLIAILLVERQKARESDALNAAVLASLPGQIFIVDRHGDIIVASPPRNDLPLSLAVEGANYADCWRNRSGVSPADCSRVIAAVNALLAGKSTESIIELRHASGTEYHWLEIRLEPLHRPQGGAVVAHLDITSGKRAENEARQSKEAILHLNRIASMGELAASLAHELNQPLAGILANAQAAVRFLNRDISDIEEVRAALADIQEDGTRAGEVIRNMRNMLKTGRAQTVPISVNDVATDAVALLLPDANLRRITLSLDLQANLPAISGDPIQLQQVIMNLVLNAMEAMREAHGLITVRTSFDDPRVSISVVDDGPGIMPEALARIFQPFFSTKSEGLGMGLSISRSIVEAHGGKLSAESSPGFGASFQISLPVPGEVMRT